MSKKKTLTNEEAFELADRIERIGGNVLACYVTPASATHQEPSMTIVLDSMAREIFSCYPIKTTFRSIHDSKNWYIDRFGGAWQTFWEMDYMKTKEYREKNKRKHWWKRWLF